MDHQQSSSKKKKKKKISFFAKIVKKVSCFHTTPTEASSISEQNAAAAAAAAPVVSVQRQQQKRPHLVIYVGGVGIDKESMMSYNVSLKYVAYPTFQKLMLEKSGGEDLETILSRGSVVMHCEVSEFDYELKVVKAKEREAVRGKLVYEGYDERIWSRYWKEVEKEKSKTSTSTNSSSNNN